jgi:hypothetical protein
MNERIQEIADQAAKWAQKANWSIDLKFGDRPYTELYNEKFAELIINDIGQIVSGLIVPETFEQEIGPYEHWNRALGTVALEIEQHFGVDE